MVGASGLDPREGCFTTELSEAEIKKQILARASHRLLLADFTKWGRTSTVRFAPWTDFNGWVADRLPARAETGALRNASVRMHQAGRGPAQA